MQPTRRISRSNESHRFWPVLALAALLAGAALNFATAQPRAAGPAVPIADGDALFTNPQWSPDGSRIAFSAERYTGIYVLDLGDGSITTVTDAPAAGFGFEWAPDGSSILARVAEFDGPRRRDAVALLDPASGAMDRLTEFRADMPALPHWDASGANVVLYAQDELEVFSVREAEPGKRAPETWIAGTTGLARVNAGARTVEALDVFPERPILNPEPSPSGDRIAFEVMGGNLFVVNSDGTGLVDLGRGHRPAWSPDGEWVVFMRTEDDGHAFTQSDLHAARADGSDVVQLTSTPDRLEMNPDWSPDGTAIAFDDFNDGIIYRLPISY